MRATFAVIVLAGPVALPAFADDLFPPPWRGTQGSTFQCWTFNDGDNPAVPEAIANPFGSALAIIEPTYSQWGSWVGRTGMWEVSEWMRLDIANRPEPLAYKDVWLQVTYANILSTGYGWIVGAPQISISGATFLGETLTQLESGRDYQWWHSLTKWRIAPNPPQESINLTWPEDPGDPVNSNTVQRTAFSS